MKSRYSSVFNFSLGLPRIIQFGAAVGVIAAGSTAQAVDFYKANNTNNLNTALSWVDSAGVPMASPPGTSNTSPDVFIWDNRVTAENTVTLGNNIATRTVRILDPGGPVTITSPSHTLTVNSGGGIDMSLATQNLTLGGTGMFYRVAASGANITHNVPLGRTLTINSQMTVREDAGSVTVSHPGAGKTIYNNVVRPTNISIAAGEVQFNNAAGSSRIGTGTTTVNGGRLVVNNTGGSATGNTAVNINSTATVTGQGSMSGLVTINSGATMIPGNGIGSLTAGSLTLAAGSTIQWEGQIADPFQTDVINVSNSGVLTINGGTFQLFNAGTTDPFTGDGVFNLIQYPGSISGSGISSLAVAESSKIPGKLYKFGLSGGYVTLTIGVDNRLKASWNVDASGNWSTGANWTGGVSPNEATAIATLGGALGTPITAARIVTLDVASTIGTLIFDSAQSFTIAGPGDLTFDDGANAATLDVENGSHVISAPTYVPNEGILANLKTSGSTLTIQSAVSGFGGIAKSGVGTLILTADNDYIGVTANGAGVLQIGAGGITGSVGGAVANSGTVRYNRSDAFVLGQGISGTGGVDFAGSGTATLDAVNTHSGPTTVSAGAIAINKSLALQNSTLTLSSTGGSVTVLDPTVSAFTSITLGGLAGDGAFPLTNTNGISLDLTVGQGKSGTYTYSGNSTGTGNTLTKVGSGTFALSGTNAFIGGTTINGGVLSLESGSDFTAPSVATGAFAGAKLRVNGGILQSTGSLSIHNTSAGFEIAAGSATFAGSISNVKPADDSGAFFVNATGGTLSAGSVNMIRGGLSITSEPTTGQTANGFYINGSAVGIAGSMSVGGGNTNSSVSARIDSGSLTVGGALTVGINNTARWSVLDIGGGTFSSTDAFTGVSLGSAFNGQAIMLVRGGVATAERIQFGQPDFTGKGILNQTGGSLYVGAGGMVVGSASPSFAAQLKLGGGVLGATANSSSTVPVSLTGPAVVTGADSLNVPHTVIFSGSVSGTGTHSLTKNGSGSVSFTSPNVAFSGTVTVSSGTLGIGGQTGSVSVAAAGALTPLGTLNVPASSVDGTLAVRYDAGASVNPGRIQSSGVLTLGAASTLNIAGTGTLTAPVYVLASGTSISGSFASVTGTVPAGYTLVTNFNSGTAIALVSATATPYDLWASSYNLTGLAAQTGFDADNDGLMNLIEFGQGSNPTQFSTGPVLGRDGNFLTLTFNHIAGGGLTFVIEANDDLEGAWDVVHTYPTFGSAGTEIYTDNVAVSSTTRRFIRLTVVNN